MDAAYYEPSGKVSFVGLTVAWIVGGFVAAVGAVVYAAALVYNPSAYLGVLLPMLYGASIGAATAAVGKRFKIRNPSVLTAFALLQTMAGYALSWMPWEWLTFSHLGQPIDLLAAIYPPTFLALLGLLYDNGAWTIGSASAGDAISGWQLGLCWVVEAGLVFGAAAITAYAVGGSGVFCETCEEWCARTKALFKHVGTSTVQITHELSNRDLDALARTPRAHPGATIWVETELSTCRCGATNTLFVEQVTRTVDGRGTPHVERIPLVKHLLITKQEAAAARAAAAR